MFAISNSGTKSAAKSAIVRAALAAFVLAGVFCITAPHAEAQLSDPVQRIGIRPDLLKNVGIDQKLNQQVPLDLTFRDENGNTVQLGRYFGQKPVVLSLVYYDCPMLCTQVLSGMEASLRNISLNIGSDFNVVTVSIDPHEDSKLAHVKQELYTGVYGRRGAAQGWHFLTGDEPQIKQLADSVGFRYAYDPDSKQFAHASTIMVLTPEGKISKYFYGITYPSRDLRLGIVDASDGKIGTPVDSVLLFCYHYDPATGKYGLLVSRLIQGGGLLTLLILGGFIFILFRHERRSHRAQESKA
ncbi:MAG: SCO family protein [Candidatus Acidiferrales bacterium]